MFVTLFDFFTRSFAGIRGWPSAIPARFSLRKRRKEIPAFAGMTKSSSVSRFLHVLFRGNYRDRGRMFPIPSRIVIRRRRVRKRRKAPGTRSCRRRNELCRGLFGPWRRGGSVAIAPRGRRPSPKENRCSRAAALREEFEGGLRGQRIAVGADRVANDAGDGFGLPVLEPGSRKRLCGGERVEDDSVRGASCRGSMAETAGGVFRADAGAGKRVSFVRTYDTNPGSCYALRLG